MTLVLRALTAPGTPFIYIRSPPPRRQPCATRRHTLAAAGLRNSPVGSSIAAMGAGPACVVIGTPEYRDSGEDTHQTNKDQETLMAAPSAEIGRSDSGLVHRPSE
jgi:hypothetical protein